MFSAIQPLQFTAKASRTGQTLQFETCRALLRYQAAPSLPMDPPAFANGLLNFFAWKIEELAPTPEARIFMLTLDGPSMNALIQSDPDHPLYVAFLDQSTIELRFKMGALQPLPGEPPCEESNLRVSLFVKLSVLVCCADE